MQNKILIGAVVVALVLGFLSLWQVLQKPEFPTDQLVNLEKELKAIKAGLPPLWGGWPSNGWMLKVENGPTVYFTGDTDLMLNWDAIREYYKPDIVIATHSTLYQMGVNEWVYAINKIKPKYVLASHHGSFPFYPTTDDDFIQAITEKTVGEGIKLPPPGQTFELMGLKITWLGHAGYIIETPQGSRIAFDPEWHAVNVRDFPEELKNPEKFAADLILVSHGHFDHFDIEALRVLLTPASGRKPHLAQIFEFAAYAKKVLPEHGDQILPINLGVWIDKEILQKAYGVKMTNLDDVEFAGVHATHSSGIFSPIK